MSIARGSLLALLALTGCSNGTEAVGAASALECDQDQLCPDGRQCGADGICEVRDDADCVCADGTDAELCAMWLERCNGQGDDGDPGAGGDPNDDCDGEPGHDVCTDLGAGCERGDAQACEIWERECRDPQPCAEGENCDPACPADDPNCAQPCDRADGNCDPPDPTGDCDVLWAACERGEDQACATWEQVCRDQPPCSADDPNCAEPCAAGENCDPRCPADDPDCAQPCDAGENCDPQCPADDPDCAQPCDAADGNCVPPQPADECGDLWARCERGDVDACAGWEQMCRDDQPPCSADDPNCAEPCDQAAGQDCAPQPASDCDGWRQRCAQGDQEACALLERECMNAQ